MTASEIIRTNRIMGMVDRILSQVIADGKGIEVNTSSFKYGVKDLMPSRAILRRYRELGGTILTIGSDTHETVHLGDHIAEVKQVLKEMGGIRRLTPFQIWSRFITACK